jgi:hypothetical protein
VLVPAEATGPLAPGGAVAVPAVARPVAATVAAVRPEPRAVTSVRPETRTVTAVRPEPRAIATVPAHATAPTGAVRSEPTVTRTTTRPARAVVSVPAPVRAVPALSCRAEVLAGTGGVPAERRTVAAVAPRAAVVALGTTVRRTTTFAAVLEAAVIRPPVAVDAALGTTRPGARPPLVTVTLRAVSDAARRPRSCTLVPDTTPVVTAEPAAVLTTRRTRRRPLVTTLAGEPATLVATGRATVLTPRRT